MITSANVFLTCVLGLLALAGGYGLTWLSARLSAALAARRWRAAADAPWPERARLAWPMRRTVALTALMLPIAVGFLFAVQIGPLLGVDSVVSAWLGWAASYLGARRASQQIERGVLALASPKTTDGATAAEAGRPVFLGDLLVTTTLGTLALTCALMPRQWGWSALGVLTAGLLLQTFNLFGGWVHVLKRLGRVHPADARLMAIVDRASTAVGVQPRSLLVVQSLQTNALAWPAPRLILFTTACRELLNNEELGAVAVHELGHLNEPRPVYWSRILVAYGFVGLALCVPLVGSFGFLAALAPAVVLLVGLFLLKRLARHMEIRSDQLATTHEGEETGTYARALEKIHEANLIPVVLSSKRQVHPDLYDRLTAAGRTPGYPRPAPPRNPGWSMAPAVVVMAVCVFLGMLSFETGGRRRSPSEAKAVTAAEEALREGDLEGALAWYQTAQDRNPWNARYPLERARLLFKLGRRPEAEAAADRAELILDAADVADPASSAGLAQFRQEFAADAPAGHP